MISSTRQNTTVFRTSASVWPNFSHRTEISSSSGCVDDLVFNKCSVILRTAYNLGGCSCLKSSISILVMFLMFSAIDYNKDSACWFAKV